MNSKKRFFQLVLILGNTYVNVHIHTHLTQIQYQTPTANKYIILKEILCALN